MLWGSKPIVWRSLSANQAWIYLYTIILHQIFLIAYYGWKWENDFEVEGVAIGVEGGSDKGEACISRTVTGSILLLGMGDILEVWEEGR